ncbi:DNRLRE domain-containing protein [Massilia aerilata]|uniref:DNRLRE domain-containing protein n=1 Tax=Massilia aerilata TaxID=453817 RepID=A0ABW0S4R8_9BURK
MRTPRRERGLVLLPVALTLAIVGAIAYSMTREGSMDVSNIDARYDIEVARYLAEAGVNLAKWQNQKRGCKSEIGFGAVALPGGSIVAGLIDQKGKNTLEVSLNATTDRGTVHAVDKLALTTFDLTGAKDATVDSSGGNDTSITLGVTTGQGPLKYLETTDGQSHALLRFPISGSLDNSSIITAQLQLTQTDSKSTQMPRSLSAHQVLHDWGAGATWTSPWTTPGGDYVPTPVATVAIAGNTTYPLPIDGLVQGWVDHSVDKDKGLLLKPSGLLEAHFASFDASANSPKLVVRYYPRCS